MTEKLRLDKWLWQARFFKSRARAAAEVEGGTVRVNAERVTKRSTQVKVSDVLTFHQMDQLRIVRIEDLGTRRGPASEAQTLYTDVSPSRAARQDSSPQNPRFEGKGRPTKRDRRTLDLSRTRSLE
ncbi:MAG: RNA-binding S4 domain-containing protein [Pseudomonadota bacterium]